MVRLNKVFSVMVMILLFCSLVYGQTIGRESLKDLKGVHVMVEELKSDIEKDGLKRSSLQTNVEGKLQKAGIKVKDQTIDEQLATIKKRFPRETEYQSALSSMNLTEDEVKMQIARGLAIRQLIEQQIASKIVITEPSEDV